MQRRRPGSRSQVVPFVPQPPKVHRTLIARGTIGWRVAILYDVLKEIGGGNWLTTFVALGKLVEDMTPACGCYYFAMRGYTIKVRYDSIEILVNDHARSDLVKELSRVRLFIQNLDRALGDDVPDHVRARRTDRSFGLRIVHKRRRRSRTPARS